MHSDLNIIGSQLHNVLKNYFCSLINNTTHCIISKLWYWFLENIYFYKHIEVYVMCDADQHTFYSVSGENKLRIRIYISQLSAFLHNNDGYDNLFQMLPCCSFSNFTCDFFCHMTPISAPFPILFSFFTKHWNN